MFRIEFHGKIAVARVIRISAELARGEIPRVPSVPLRVELREPWEPARSFRLAALGVSTGTQLLYVQS